MEKVKNIRAAKTRPYYFLKAPQSKTIFSVFYFEDTWPLHGMYVAQVKLNVDNHRKSLLRIDREG